MMFELMVNLNLAGSLDVDQFAVNNVQMQK